MKKAFTLVSILAFAFLLVGSADAQIKTIKGDFFRITRTVEQTADSVTFWPDTLTFGDNLGTLNDFNGGDSVVIFFVNNRFKIVNNMISNNQFDYIRARVSSATTMTLSRPQYDGVVTQVGAGGATIGPDNFAPYAGPGKDIGMRPVYRQVGPIASSSYFFPKDPTAVRQMLRMNIINPGNGADAIQLYHIFFKPNINNLTGLAVPPDTTKDTLRAYLLDGVTTSGQVVNATDLAIVRLLPGTTKILYWVNDSAQAVDAGEYIGSFGDYSRGRYFLGDDGLPYSRTTGAWSGTTPTGFTNSKQFRPGQFRTFGAVTVENPDEGMLIDGFPPERNPLKLTNLYQALAPYWFNEQFPTVYPNIPGNPGSNPNPINGLIPPYRVGPYAVSARPYQPGLVTSAVDTLRFFDDYGNRTWDRMTQPSLRAIAYTTWNPQGEDRTIYLKGYQAQDDTLRQYGQIVYRRLAYTHADVDVNAGGVQDSIRIIAEAVVRFTGPGGWLETLNAIADTSGGFPRTWAYSVRTVEALLDNSSRSAISWQVDPNRSPVDPSAFGIKSLPNTGVKIVVRPNIPRALDITAIQPQEWKNQGDYAYLRLNLLATDGYGNTVDDNERFKFELSPFGHLATPGGNVPYKLNGIFDSLLFSTPNVSVTGLNIDSGRVATILAPFTPPAPGYTGLGRATRVFRAASGSNNAGAYRIRARMSWALNDRYNDLNDPLKFDPNPDPTAFGHSGNIPDGSPNNNFGIWFGPGTQYNAKLGNRLGQTTAMDSTDVVWDASTWYTYPTNPRLEVVTGTDDALIVGRVGTGKSPIYTKAYVRVTDIWGNPMDIAPYFRSGSVKVELPDNAYWYGLYNGGQTEKVFFGSVSPNVAYGGAGGPSNPVNPPSFDPAVPRGVTFGSLTEGMVLQADTVMIGQGQGLPGIVGDVPYYNPVKPYYNALRFFIRAPRNVKKLSLAGTDEMRIRAYLTLSTNIPYVGDFGITSGFAQVTIVPDAAVRVEVFKSWGKPQGTTTPMDAGIAGGWSPISANDALAAGFPTGTPRNAAETNEFYRGYYFKTGYSDSTFAQPPTTSADFPTPLEQQGLTSQGIGGFQADDVSLDGDATCPIPMDTVVVSEHNQQMRLVARLLDRYANPIGGRYVKFFVESETLPITLPKTQLQNNAQRGGFGEFNRVWVSDDTLKRTTIGDTAQAGWVTAYFVSGRVSWQIVRVALTPDTLAFDVSPIGKNLGEGTVVGPSQRGFAPRVIIPIFQKSDTTVKVEIFPYTAAATSPVPLPTDLVEMQALEHVSIYPGVTRNAGYGPYFHAWSANPFAIDQRATHLGRVANSNIRPYIPDTLNLTDNTPTSANSITAGRTILLLAREYDRFGNLVDNQPMFEDTARIRFRIWGANFNEQAPLPYTTPSGIGGSIAPARDWTRDEYGPMRKARYRHTRISNLVSGVHINQTANLIGLELPTPKLNGVTMFIEATATAVLPFGLPGAVDINRDTCKIVTVVKTPTRFDILRAGQEFLNGGGGVNPYINDPESRTLNIFAFNISLPPGTDINEHKLDAVSVDNVLVSQAYKRDWNQNSYRVGKYLVVDENNVPLDRLGNPLFADPNADFNPSFERDPYSKLPVFQKLDAYNNLDPLTTPNDAFNRLNQGTQIPGARTDATGYFFDVTIAGGGAIVDAQNYLSLGYMFVCDQNTGQNVRVNQRPVLLRVTPIWENNPPTGGNPYVVANFTGKNAQPGQTKVYDYRLYADSIYTYRGNTSVTKATALRGEWMGTWTDRGRPGSYSPSYGFPNNQSDYDRITRLGVRGWDPQDFTIAGLNGMTRYPIQYPPAGAGGPTLLGGLGNPSGPYFNGDYNRRVMLMSNGFGVSNIGGNLNMPQSPGCFVRLIDSTAEQVVELRVVAGDLTDMAGKVVDDTCSYDQGKWTVIRRHQRVSNRFWHLDDTYWAGGDGLEYGIQGPNLGASFNGDIPWGIPVNRKGFSAQAPEAAANRSFFSFTMAHRMNHYFVVIPYRTAYMSLFPSSYDLSQGLFDNTRLPLGILPVQADIDTLPRVSVIYYNDGIHNITNFEMYTRLYGQVAHGATDLIPNNNNTPYARPDTVFRDLRYVYAVTPYDRYGNQNFRDSMFIQVTARTTDWRFENVQADGGLLVRSGGEFFGAIPVNTPSGPDNVNFRQDTLRLLNPVPASIFRNEYVGIKPDDPLLTNNVGRPGGINIPHGILPANIISSRPVWVKQAFAPAPFVLSTAGRGNPTLFRMDHNVLCNQNKLYEEDILRLNWQISQWAAQSKKNNPNDTVKYEVYFIIDSVGTGTKTLTVSVLADNDGIDPTLTLSGDKVRELIFRPGVQPQPNQDSLVMRVKWFIRAYNKVGMSTYSDTAGATIRNTPLPTPPLIISMNRPPFNAPTPVTPVNNATINGISATTPPIDVIWTPASDININKGILIGGFKVYNIATQSWIDDPSGRTVDTLSYQWVGTVVRTFPVGKGAALGTKIVKNTGSTSGFQLGSSDLDALFAGFSTDPTSTSADSVIVDWEVYVKDFNQTDALPMEDVYFRYNPDGTLAADTAKWSRFGCRPHELLSNTYRVNLTKLDNGGVEIDPMSSDPDINKVAGEEVVLHLTAKDKNGNIIRDWDRKGAATTLKITNSTANTDTSTQSWSADPTEYSWAVIYDANGQPLTTISADEFSIPASLFVDGKATIKIIHTKAENGVQIVVSPTAAFVNQTSSKMNFSVGGVTNFLVELTSATANPDQTFLMRRYEIIVSPRDKYLNVSNTTVKCKFSARFPGEYDATLPGLSDIFSGEVFITGPTNYFLASRIARVKGNDELQWVRCYLATNDLVRGQTAPYEILHHAPNAFALTSPPDHSTIALMSYTDREKFTWVKATPQDPYTDIQISRFNPTKYSDVVTYTMEFVDSASLTHAYRVASDNNGVDASYSTTHGQLGDVINTISGSPTTVSWSVVWRIEATDGLYKTYSTPPNQDPNNAPGWYLYLIKKGILSNGNTVPTEFAISQNYPNPFNPTTTISYDLPKSTDVTIQVYDLLGAPVKTLVSKHQDAGSYTVNWDATNDLGMQVPTGNYIYKIMAGSFTQTRKMTLMK